jgi:hypothetical protein
MSAGICGLLIEEGGTIFKLLIEYKSALTSTSSSSIFDNVIE